MKPLVKYQGGKSRELKTITKMMPKEFNRVVEPFCGGAAVAFSVGKPAVLCDTNFDIINVYKCMGEQQGLRRICNHVRDMKLKGHDELEEMYYDARYIINQPIHETDPTPWSRGYPWAGYNFTHYGGNLTRIGGDYAWGISYGNNNRLSFNFAVNGSAGTNLTWLERAHIDLDGHFNVGASAPGGRLFNVSAGGSRDIASFTDDNVGLVIQAKSDGSDFTEIVSYRDQDSSYDKLGLRGANYGIVIDATSGNVGFGGELSPDHALEVEESNNYQGVHIRGSNAPCFTMAKGTTSTPEWRVGISGYAGPDFAISTGSTTGDQVRMDPSGNTMFCLSGTNFAPRAGMSSSASLATRGPIISGYSQGNYNGAARNTRDWFVYAGPPTNSGVYVHMKTDLDMGTSSNSQYTMSSFTYHNYYAYGGSYGRGQIGWHNWSGSFYNVTRHNEGTHELVQPSYVSTDGKAVLVAKIDAGYAQFSIDWFQWAGYTFRTAKVTAVTQSSSATGAY